MRSINTVSVLLALALASQAAPMQDRCLSAPPHLRSLRCGAPIVDHGSDSGGLDRRLRISLGHGLPHNKPPPPAHNPPADTTHKPPIDPPPVDTPPNTSSPPTGTTRENWKPRLDGTGAVIGYVLDGTNTVITVLQFKEMFGDDQPPSSAVPSSTPIPSGGPSSAAEPGPTAEPQGSVAVPAGDASGAEEMMNDSLS